MHRPHETAHSLGQATGIQFLDNELDLCQTFLDLAETDADDPAVADQARANARRGFEAVLSLIHTVRDPGELDRLTTKLDRLNERLGSAPDMKP